MNSRYGAIRFRSAETGERYYGVGLLWFDEDPAKIVSCSVVPEISVAYDEHDGNNDCHAIRSDLTDQLEQMISDIKHYPIFDCDGPFAKSWREMILEKS